MLGLVSGESFTFILKCFFCLFYSSGLAQTVESQHQKESWRYLVSVGLSVLPAQVIDCNKKVLLFYLFIYCNHTLNSNIGIFFLGIFNCTSCRIVFVLLFCFFCHDATTVWTSPLTFKLCPQPVWPPCGEASEEAPVPHLQQSVPHHQQRPPEEPRPVAEAVASHPSRWATVELTSPEHITGSQDSVPVFTGRFIWGQEEGFGSSRQGAETYSDKSLVACPFCRNNLTSNEFVLEMARMKFKTLPNYVGFIKINLFHSKIYHLMNTEQSNKTFARDCKSDICFQLFCLRARPQRGHDCLVWRHPWRSNNVVTFKSICCNKWMYLFRWKCSCLHREPEEANQIRRR